MKLVRLLSRIALLSMAAAAFVALTGIYGDSVPQRAPSARTKAVRGNRPPGPHVSEFSAFVGAGAVVAMFALAGRLVFGLRLSPASSNEEKPILLGLHRNTRIAG